MAWPAQHGRLGTVKVAHKYGTDLDMNCTGTEVELESAPEPSPTRLRLFGTPLHFAIRAGHLDIAGYLLENGVSVHVPSWVFFDSMSPGVSQIPYPLHYALERQSIDGVDMLIRHGAYLVAKGVSALPMVSRLGRPDLIELLLDLDATLTPAVVLRVAAGLEDLELF